MGPLSLTRTVSRAVVFLRAHTCSNGFAPATIICDSFCHKFSSSPKSSDAKSFRDIRKHADRFRDVLDENKEKMRATQRRLSQKRASFVKSLQHQRQVAGQKIQERKAIIIKDILETKTKVKEKIEEAIEVSRSLRCDISFA